MSSRGDLGWDVRPLPYVTGGPGGVSSGLTELGVIGGLSSPGSPSEAEARLATPNRAEVKTPGPVICI